MTEPPSGWSAPGQPPPSYGEPPPGYPPPPSGYPQQPQWGPQSATPWGQPAPPVVGVVPLRPLGLGEMLDGAVKIIRRYPRPTLGLSAVIAIASTLVNMLFVYAIYTPPTVTATDDPFSQFDEQFSSSVAVQGPGAIIGYLAGLIMTGALVVVVGKAVLGHPVQTSEVWATVRQRFWALLGLSLLTGLIVAGPALLGVLLIVVLAVSGGGGGAVALAVLLMLGCVAGSAYLYVRLALAPAALVLERTGIRAALRRSSVLVRGTWWRVFGILLLTGIIGTVLSSIIGAPVGIIGATAGDGESRTFVMLTQVASGLASVLVAPFSSGVGALLYVDRRMRAEGLDVALQAAAAAPPA